MTSEPQGPADMPSRAPSPRLRRRLPWLALLLGLPLCGWLGWMAAMTSSQMGDYQRLREERAGIQAELEQTRLRDQQLEVDLMVARQALADSQAAVAELEQQLFRLQQDLAQYQGALAPNAMAHGVRIQAFELQRTDIVGIFRYKVMVSRVGSESDTVQARLLLTLQGRQGDEEVSYPLEELTSSRTQYLPLNFRYFQVVPGNDDAELVLPLGFEPEQIELKVEHDGKIVLEQTLKWTETGVRS